MLYGNRLHHRLKRFAMPHSALNHSFAPQKCVLPIQTHLWCLREVQNPGLSAAHTHTHTHTQHKFFLTYTPAFSLLFPPAVLLSPHNSPSSCFTKHFLSLCLNFSPFTHSSLKMTRKRDSPPPPPSRVLLAEMTNRKQKRVQGRTYQNDKYWAFQPNACNQYDYCSD